MSYDLQWADLPEPAASARARYDACDWYDDPPCPHDPPCLETYLTLANPYLFHLTISGMAEHIAGMRRTGMCFDAEPERLAEPAEPADQEADEELRRRHAAQRVPGGVGIPVFKLTSNGPWLVTAEEIGQALAAYDRAPAETRAHLEAEASWQTWLAWLRTCREHGGFLLE